MVQVKHFLKKALTFSLSRKYNTDYFQALAPCFDSISEADAECTIRTLERFYQILSERRSPDEKR